MAERSSKRSRSATGVRKSTKKREHRSKSQAVSRVNKQSAKLSAARMVANAVSMGFLGIEKKFLDTSISGVAIAATADCTGAEMDPTGSGCTGTLSCPAQGDSEQQRNGKKFTIDSLILKGFVVQPASISSAPFASAKVFVAVVLDTQTNAAQLNSEDVFKSLAATISTNVDPMKNLLFGKRFRLLKTQVYDLTPVGVSSGASGVFTANGVRRDFDWYIPFKGGLPVECNATATATVANVIDNSLHVIAYATSGDCTMSYNARIRFQG
jgi:hypothetical protein